MKGDSPGPECGDLSRVHLPLGSGRAWGNLCLSAPLSIQGVPHTPLGARGHVGDADKGVAPNTLWVVTSRGDALAELTYWGHLGEGALRPEVRKGHCQLRLAPVAPGTGALTFLNPSLPLCLLPCTGPDPRSASADCCDSFQMGFLPSVSTLCPLSPPYHQNDCPKN